MKIALIDGSPKINNSASSILLEELKYFFAQGKVELIEMGLHTLVVSEEIVKQLKRADIWIFALPLYVDGIPSHLLSCFIQIENRINDICKKYIKNVYSIVNCGFYEGEHTEPALQILENWCCKAQLNWCGGVGVGGGGSLSMLPKMPNGQGPKAPIDKMLKHFVEKIIKQEIQKNQYVSVGMPRFMYQLCAQIGWRQLIRKNGGKIKDLGRKF